MRNTIIALTLVSLLGACGSVQNELATAVRELEPKETPVDEGTREVSVPALEERQQDDHFLARIQKLTEENMALRESKNKLEEEVASCRKTVKTARGSEGELAQDNERLQGLLADATARERKLEENLLRIRLENVRLKQALNEAHIRELRGGASK